VCIAAGDNGAVATSTDGQTFVLTSALQTTTNWGSRRAAAICADPSSPTLVYAICTDGTIASSNDYGVSWTANNGLFTANQRYDFNPVDEVPVSCWLKDSYLFISLYGGQVFRSTGGGVAADISNNFNGYYTSFGTPDISGLSVNNSLAPATTIRGMFAGGFGRVLYLTTGIPFNFSQDMLLLSALVSGGFQTAEVCCAYYDPLRDMAFVGLTSGRLAHRQNPLVPGTTWNVAVLPGVPADIVGINRLPSGDYIAVAEYINVAVGFYVGGNVITWAVNSSLFSYTVSGDFVREIAGSGSNVRAITSGDILATTDGISWTPGSYAYPPIGGPADLASVTYDPRAQIGFDGGYVASYSAAFGNAISATPTSSSFWSGSLLSIGNPPAVGSFTFGLNKVTIALQPTGSGLISTNPTSPGGWGSVPGLSSRQPSTIPPPVPNYYYPTSPVYKSAGAVTAVDVGIAAGAYGRIWLSF
jgi:hypothetical protein